MSDKSDLVYYSMMTIIGGFASLLLISVDYINGAGLGLPLFLCGMGMYMFLSDLIKTYKRMPK